MKLLVSSILGVLLLFSSVSTVADRPAPCVCKGSASCNGETQCDAGQWAACRCVNGHCAGRCVEEREGGKKGSLYNALTLAAAVLTEVTNEKVEREDVKREKEKYVPILKELLSSENGSGTYTINFNGRISNFGFSATAVRKLKLVIDSP